MDTDGKGFAFLGRRHEKNATHVAGRAQRRLVSQRPIFLMDHNDWHRRGASAVEGWAEPWCAEP